jgi:beta-glucanase (GH16 family)
MEKKEMKAICYVLAALLGLGNGCTKEEKHPEETPEEQPAGETPAEEITPPEGYALVWHDEFDAPSRLPDAREWWYETGNHGWGNNEIQRYVAGVYGPDTTTILYNGTLKIIARKRGGEVISARMNTQKSWLYGYFEARLKLPQGRGTWPAFWMMPANYTAWPDDGEIDIMEEVGFRPNWVSSSIHCKAYYHGIGTQKTAERFVATAETGFHLYAVEWTPDFIKGYIDNEPYFEFANDKKGNKDTWPFYQPFYLKLNLAWGGNWGGAQGVDESCLPAIYETDYVRVYQRKENK